MSKLSNRVVYVHYDYGDIEEDLRLHRLELRGEIIHCKECGACYLTEFDDGNGIVGMSETIKKHQVKLSQKYFPNYDAEQNGYYYHHFALCEYCAKKLEVNIFEEDHVIFRYLGKIKEASEFEHTLKWKIKSKIKNELTKEILIEINTEAFYMLKSEKHFNIKKEKRKLAEIYVKSSRNKLHKYMNKCFDTDSEWLELKKEILMLKKDVHKFLNSDEYRYKFSIKGYKIMELENEFALGIALPYKSFTKELASVLLRENNSSGVQNEIFEINSNKKFYRDFKYPKALIYGKDLEIRKIFAKKDRYDDLDMDDMCERLPAILSKADIWD